MTKNATGCGDRRPGGKHKREISVSWGISTVVSKVGRLGDLVGQRELPVLRAPKVENCICGK